ncbi:MAG: DNA-processing protein DprA [Hespellia sp.]|nr:DNA-processing protein DprA [Hespellia sp.]
MVREAREKSGSLITADAALEQGKDVYALPGAVNSPLSSGCNRLIRQGAGILLSPEDLLEEMGISQGKIMKNVDENKIKLETQENLVYSCLDFTPKSLTEIVRECNLSVSLLLDILVSLELKGLVGEISKKYYTK